MERFIIFTTPHCTRCIVNKKKLKDAEINFTEISVVDCTPAENLLLDKYNVKTGGTVVDTVLGVEVNMNLSIEDLKQLTSDQVTDQVTDQVKEEEK